MRENSVGAKCRRSLVAAAVATAFAAAGHAAPAAFKDRASFEASATGIVVDGYEAADGYMAGNAVPLTDIAMSEIFGETMYRSTGFADNHFIFRPNDSDLFDLIDTNLYCAGCNGSFSLDFTQTSLSVGGGVSAVALDVGLNLNSSFDGLVRFADGSSQLYRLDGGFFGLTSSVPIAGIDFGPGGMQTTEGGFAIDNLSIGNSLIEIESYLDRNDFAAVAGASITDGYEPADGYNPGNAMALTDAEMSAVFSETRYQSTGIPDNHFIFRLQDSENSLYCAGCNSSFLLDFSETSLAVDGAVFAVGFDVALNEGEPFDALINFGDGSSRVFRLDGDFFGLSSALGIRSISFGPNGLPSVDGAFAIDNLSFAAGRGVAVVPEPASWALLVLGFGLTGILMRARRPDALKG